MKPASDLPLVYIIRHGETSWSSTGRHTGRSDPPLTQQGEQEAAKLGKRLRGLTFARVFTSPRLRARRTCELFGLEGASEIEADLAEWDYGDYEGWRTIDIRKRTPEWNLFHDGCPGGESPMQIEERADRLIARLRTVRGNIALFSHGHFGRVLGVRWIGLPVAQAGSFSVSTASVSVLGYEHGRAEEPAITLWNADAFHLCDSHLPLGDLRPMKQRALERWENEGGEIVPPPAPPGNSTSRQKPGDRQS
jgi:broad specificity phosphatase PhoE